MTNKIVATGVAVLAIAGGGAAVAATTLGTPQAESKAIVDDAAAQLGVDSTKLSNALKQALENRVDAAVAAGQLTKAQGDAAKARIEADDYPILGGFGFERHGDHGGPGGPGGPGGHGFGHLDAAATYLGLSATALQTQLSGGKTLAAIAKAQGKTVDGLVAALLADEKNELAAAVTAGRLTQAQADDMLTNAKQRFTDMVNGVMPARGPDGFGGRHGFGGPGGPGGFGGPPPVAPSTAGMATA